MSSSSSSLQVWTRDQAGESGRWNAHEFALLVGVSNSTIKRWAKQKIVVPQRFHNRFRYYTEEHLVVVFGPDKSRFFMVEIPRRVAQNYTFAEAVEDVDKAWTSHCRAQRAPKTKGRLKPSGDSSELKAEPVVQKMSDSSTSSGS